MRQRAAAVTETAENKNGAKERQNEQMASNDERDRRRGDRGRDGAR